MSPEAQWPSLEIAIFSPTMTNWTPREHATITRDYTIGDMDDGRQRAALSHK